MLKRFTQIAVVFAFVFVFPLASHAAIEDYYGVWEIQFDIGPYKTKGYQFRVGDTPYDQLSRLDVPWKTHRPWWQSDLNSNANSQYMDYVQLPTTLDSYYDWFTFDNGNWGVQLWLDMQQEGFIESFIRLVKKMAGTANSWYYNTDVDIEATFNEDYSQAEVVIKVGDWTTYRTYEMSGTVYKVCDF